MNGGATMAEKVSRRCPAIDVRFVLIMVQVVGSRGLYAGSGDLV